MKPDQPYALITGGISGIGYQLAKLFVKDNYNLLIVGRNQKELDNTADELCSYNNNKTEVIPIAKDLFKTSETPYLLVKAPTMTNLFLNLHL